MKRSPQMVRRIIIMIFVCTLFASCAYTKEDAQKYLPGHYFYAIPSGEYQELDINSDFTFKQVVYSKGKKNVLFENAGRMYVDGENIRFRDWLECYELAEQKTLAKPYITYSTGIYWRKPKGNVATTIVKFDETNYVFKKLK